MLGFSEEKQIERLKSRIESAEEGRFIKVTRLGVGGHAYTFQAEDTTKRARDTEENRKVAIKISKREEEDVIDEGIRAALLSPHPYIVEVYGTCRYEGTKRALVMEFIEGCNLRKLLPRLSGNVKAAVRIMIHICEALKKAHEHTDPIVHRDVKPENILISAKYPNWISFLNSNRFGDLILDHFWEQVTAKLTDFGIALEANMQITQVIGSLPYMAPEQLDRSQVDARSDLYAATVVLYEMLEGTTPFRGETQNLIQQITTHRPPSLRDDLPSGLKRIVYKGLEKRPEDRYQTANDLLCDLEVFQYFEDKIVRAAEEFGQELAEKYRDPQRVYLRLSEMHTDQSIDTLSHLRSQFESHQPNPNTSFRLALLHGAASEYDQAEAAIQETQTLDLQNPAHPLKQEHPFIKRFATPQADEQPPEEETHPDEGDNDSTDQSPGKTDSDEEDNDYTDRLRVVEELLNRGAFEKAREAADEILNACTALEVYLSLGHLFYDEDILDKVIEICERGIQRHENQMELYALLGSAAYARDPKRAAEAIEKAIQLGCEDPELADLLRDLKNR